MQVEGRERHILTVGPDRDDSAWCVQHREPTCRLLAVSKAIICATKPLQIFTDWTDRPDQVQVRVPPNTKRRWNQRLQQPRGGTVELRHVVMQIQRIGAARSEERGSRGHVRKSVGTQEYSSSAVAVNQLVGVTRVAFAPTHARGRPPVSKLADFETGGLGSRETWKGGHFSH